MTTILNSIAIICLAIAFILHIIKFHKPTKFELTIEDLERHKKLQNWIEESNKQGKKYMIISKEILNNVPSSNRNSESESRS